MLFISAKDERRVRVVHSGCAIVDPPQRSSALLSLWLVGPLALLIARRRRGSQTGVERASLGVTP